MILIIVPERLVLVTQAFCNLPGSMEVADKDVIERYIEELDAASNVKFSRLLKICEDTFGSCRIRGSHHVFQMPWQGDPRINLQADGPNAKRYQVRQVVDAMKKIIDAT